MTAEQRVAGYKRQFETALANYHEQDPQCAFAAGMLLILSAMKKFDGPSLPLQVSMMHKALTDLGLSRGWGIDKNGAASPAGGNPPDHGAEPGPGQPSEPPTV